MANRLSYQLRFLREQVRNLVAAGGGGGSIEKVGSFAFDDAGIYPPYHPLVSLKTLAADVMVKDLIVVPTSVWVPGTDPGSLAILAYNIPGGLSWPLWSGSIVNASQGQGNNGAGAVFQKWDMTQDAEPYLTDGVVTHDANTQIVVTLQGSPDPYTAGSADVYALILPVTE